MQPEVWPPLFRFSTLFTTLKLRYAFFKELGYSGSRFVVSVFLTFFSSLLQYGMMSLFFLLIRAIMTKQFRMIPKRKVMIPLFAALPSSFAEGYHAVLVLAAILIAIKLALFVLRYLSLVLIEFDQEQIAEKIQCQVYATLLEKGSLSADQTNLSQKVKLIESSAQEVSTSIGHLHTLFSHLARVFIISLCLFEISPVFMLISMVCFSFIFLLSKSSLTQIRNGMKALRRNHAELSERIYNSLSHASLVKAYNMEQAEAQRFNASIHEASAIKRRAFHLENRLQFLNELNILLLLTILAVFAPQFFPLSEQYSVSHILIFFIALRMLEPSFQRIYKTIGALDTFSASLDQIRELFRFSASAKGQKISSVTIEGQPIHSFEQALELKNLTFSYPSDSDGTKPLFNGLNLRLKKGHFLALTGNTGTGKTTLSQILIRLLPVAPESFFIDQRPVEQLDTSSVRSLISLAPQTPVLFNDTIRNNLTYGLNRHFTEEQLDQAAQKAQILSLIRSLKYQYDTPLQNFGAKFSGGERQRLSLARLFLNPAPIYILDEATNALDLNTETLIVKELELLKPEKTIIFISHRLNILKAADEAYELVEGKLLPLNYINPN